MNSTTDDHTHCVDLFITVCEEPMQHIAHIDIDSNDTAEASRILASALRSVANVIDTKGTFEELVEGL